MTPHLHWLHNYTPCRIPICLADNRVVYSAGVGSVVFQPEVEEKLLHPVEFSRVLHVPDLRNNLLSVLYLVLHSQFHIHIYHHCMDFLRDKRLLFCAPIDPTHTAYLSGSVLPITHFANLSAVSGILPLYLPLWHRHLAHYTIREWSLSSPRALLQALNSILYPLLIPSVNPVSLARCMLIPSSPPTLSLLGCLALSTLTFMAFFLSKLTLATSTGSPSLMTGLGSRLPFLSEPRVRPSLLSSSTGPMLWRTTV